MAKQGGAGLLAIVVCLGSPANVAQAQTTETVQIRPVPAPPPAPIAVPPPYSSSSRPARLKPVFVSLEVFSDANVLYKGDLRVGDSNASYTMNVNEAYEACPADDNGVPRFSNVNSSIRVMVSRREKGSKNAERFNITVNWIRPGPACEGGVSTIGFDRNVGLNPGETVKLTGDAGLSVRVTRAQ